MKKASLILSSALLIGLLAGCGNSGNDAAAPTASPSNAPAEATATADAGAGAETGAYEDGTYYGTIPAEEGWQTYVLLTVEGGAIKTVDWNAFNVTNAGDLKKKVSEEGKYGMKEKGGAQAEWHEQAIAAQKYFVENQGAAPAFDAEGKTDAISGVSVHIDEYWNLAEQALEGAK